MILVSLIAMRLAEKEGYWLVLLISFIALPIRGVHRRLVMNKWGVYPVQILDGVGAGLQSVAVPGLVARILDGTGRVNVGQGAVMTVQGLGASLSPAIGGWIAQEIGYSAMFLILGSFALGSIALWLGFASVLKPACARRDGSDASADGNRIGGSAVMLDDQCRDLGDCSARNLRRDRPAVEFAGVHLGGGRCGAAGAAPSAAMAGRAGGRRQGHGRLFLSDRHDAAGGSGAARRACSTGSRRRRCGIRRARRSGCF